MNIPHFIALCFALLSLTEWDVYSITPQQLQDELDKAIQAGKSKFTIPGPADYYFNKTSFYVRNAKNMAITTDKSLCAGTDMDKTCATKETTFWFALGAGFQVHNSEHVGLDGFSIDYDPPPFSQGKVISRDGNTTITMQLQKGYPAPNTLPPPLGQDPAILPVFWSSSTRNIRCDHWYRQNAENIHHTPNKPDDYFTMTLPGLKFDPTGDLITVNPRHGYTYSIANSSHITSKNVRLYAATFMAVTEFDGEGGHVYEGMVVTRRGDRLLASNADLFHSSGVKNGPKVRHCDFGFANDDFFNVHLTLVLNLKRVSDTTFYLVDPHIYDRPNDSIYGTVLTLANVKPGDKLDFYELNTFLSLATSTVTSSRRITDPAVIKMAKEMPFTMNAAPFSAMPKIMLFTPLVYEITFAEPLPSSVIPYGTLVSFNQWAAAGAVLENNSFHDSTCNLGRWKSSNGRITHNKFNHACLHNLEVRPIQGWMEGQLGIHNVTINYNTIIASGMKPFHVKDATDVRIANNTILP